MQLHARKIASGTGSTVCIHGVSQHGGVFAVLNEHLEAEREVIAVDLRGHGRSDQDPPWDTRTHVADVLETLSLLELEKATLIGHSFGARVAAAVAATAPGLVDELVLLDPALEIPAGYALASAEIDRLDWTFASVEGAVSALMSAKSTVDVPRETVTEFAEGDLRRAPDGRLRFSYSPSAAVVSWSEMVLPAPPIANVRTLLVRPVASHIDGREQDRRYREALGSLLNIVAVPKGHNVLWESPAETVAAIDGFLQPKS